MDLFLSHGQLALVQLTGWLLLIDIRARAFAPFCMVNELWSTSYGPLKPEYQTTESGEYLGTCLMVLADRLLGLGGSVSIHGGFSHSPRLCFVPALGLDHPSSVLPALLIMELYDLPFRVNE